MCFFVAATRGVHKRAKTIYVVLLLISYAVTLLAQRTYVPEDWEEVNFAEGSDVLVDGFPSLLHLAEQLRNHPDYRVVVTAAAHSREVGEGVIGRLAVRRGERVRDFLVKYGAREEQVMLQRVPPIVLPRRASREARFVARRVNFALTDASGRTVHAGVGGINDVIRVVDDIELAMRGNDPKVEISPEEAERRVHQKLDMTDDIRASLNKMISDNDDLRRQLNALQRSFDELDQYAKALPKTLNEAQTAEIVDTRTAEQIERTRLPRLGSASWLTGSGPAGQVLLARGTLFLPSKEQFAAQLQGELIRWYDWTESQFDAGLVNRISPRIEVSLFGSIKHVALKTPLSAQVTLGHTSTSLEMIYSRGRIGVFGAKRLTDSLPLRAVDQAGMYGVADLGSLGSVEGIVSWRSKNPSREHFGGSGKWRMRLSNQVAVLVEGGVNETLLRGSRYGRIAIGVELGTSLRASDYIYPFNDLTLAAPATAVRVVVAEVIPRF